MKIHAISPAFAAADQMGDAYGTEMNAIRFGTHYFADTCLKVHCYDQVVVLTDLTNAMKAGKKCVQVKFWAGYRHDASHRITQLLDGYRFNYKLLFDNLKELGSLKGEDVELEGITGRVSVEEEAAVRTFSPFAQLNPLKELPAKWTVAHVLRALVNGQYRNLSVDMQTTDDYQFDAAYNFGKGAIEGRPFEMIERLVDRPDGWWINAEKNGKVGVNNGHFDYRSFELVLRPVEAAAQPAEPRRAAA